MSREKHENIMFEKAKAFSLRIVRLYSYLREEKIEYVLSKQMLRSGTSIGANLAEAQYAISLRDFLSKEYISLKECAETQYWLELLFKGEFLNESEYNSISSDCEELLKLLTASTKTIKSKLSTKE